MTMTKDQDRRWIRHMANLQSRITKSQNHILTEQQTSYFILSQAEPTSFESIPHMLPDSAVRFSVIFSTAATASAHMAKSAFICMP